jgi:hypothetical protein
MLLRVGSEASVGMLGVIGGVMSPKPERGRAAWFRWAAMLGVAASVAPLGASAQEQSTQDALAQFAWDDSHRGEALDTSHLRATFSDEFDRMSVTAEGGGGLWFAPARENFGPVKLSPPGPKGPFFVRDGILTIQATSPAKGIWLSGHMQTMDRKGCGFSQQYGYFEARIRLSDAQGSWGGFWLKTANEFSQRDAKSTRGEIDVVEFYGSDPVRHHMAVHLWPRGATAAIPKHWFKSHIVASEGLAGAFHRYGVLVTPEITAVFVDRREVSRVQTLPEDRQPLYMLLTLNLGRNELLTAPSPMTMQVDYVKAYAVGKGVAAPSPELNHQSCGAA